MDRLSEMETYICVVDQGGFTDAAERLKISKSAVSKHVSSLETRLGVRLLNRTTRRVSPTEIGLAYYDRARKVISDAAEADDLVTAMQSTPRGLLQISAPLSFGIHHGAPAVARFMEDHPDVSVNLVLNDRRVDLVSEGFDLALRIGNLTDSSLMSRKIAETDQLMIASPAYLAKHGTPQKIDDLMDHQLLHYSISAQGNYWRVMSPTGEERQIRVGARLVANNGDVLLRSAIEGIGIAQLPSFFLSKALATGELTQVLSDHPTTKMGVHVVYPPGRYVQPKTRAFIDFMAQYFKTSGPLNWSDPHAV